MQRKILNIEYNSQRDNIATPVAGPMSQCGYNAAWMWLSHFIPKIHSSDDGQLAKFVDGMEPAYGLYGFGDDILESHPEYAGRRMGAFMENYSRIISRYLELYGIQGHLVYREGYGDKSGSLQEIIDAIDGDSPVFLSTRLTSAGHFVLVIGYDFDQQSLIIHDPFGNATGDKPYSDQDGEAVLYSFDKIREVTVKQEIGWRYIWLDKREPAAA